MGKKNHKTKRNEHTELSLTSDSGVAKAEVFPHLKTNAKSHNKTHAQPFLHANILSPFKFLQLWRRTEALVFNKSPCLSCLAPRVRGYPSSQVTNGQINPTDTHVGRHVCSRCSESLFPCRKHICDLSTPRYRWSHPRGTFVTFHSVKTKMNPGLGVFNVAGPQKAFAKVLSVVWRNTENKAVRRWGLF